MKFVKVPSGSFEMGCHANAGKCRSNEKPVRTVRLDSFWMGKHEVTQGQWKRVMGSNPSNFKKGDDYPVEQVSWNEVQQFIRRLNSRSSARFRLPSEAQWEFACRSGGRPVTFGTGDGGVTSGNANINRNNGGTTPVGRYPANALGLHDMSGNLWEWVQDKKTSYGNVGNDNPIYERSGGLRVIRGGSWSKTSRNLRCSDRGWGSPSHRSRYLGFRLRRSR
ncbi:MAG: formylglycine-generating enzyme family protein [SAR324 cluster bacterium]|nr:formylglycine-generating enzyme family protein [SAR324 cluster bacterium]